MIASMLKIRLQRVARKHVPIFRVVLTDSRNSTKSGKFKEVLGTYNLVTDEKRVDAERVKYWLSRGAQPSGTVRNFLVDEHIISGKKVNVLPRKRPVKKDKKEKKEAAGTAKEEGVSGTAAAAAEGVKAPAAGAAGSETPAEAKTGEGTP